MDSENSRVYNLISETARRGGSNTFAFYRRRDGRIDEYFYEDFLHIMRRFKNHLSKYSFETEGFIIEALSRKFIYEKALILLPQTSDSGLFFLLRCFFSGAKIIVPQEITKRAVVDAIGKFHPDVLITDAVSFATLTRGFEKDKEFYRKKVFGSGLRFIYFVDSYPRGESLEALHSAPVPVRYFRFADNFFLPVCYGFVNKKGLVSSKVYGKRDFRLVGGESRGRGELEILSAGEFVPTGIAADITPRGRIHVLSDMCDCIKDESGGIFSPFEFEQKYISVKSIKEIAAFPVDNGTRFSLAAVMRREDGLTPTVTRLMVQNRAENLPEKFRPKKIYIIPHMPRDENNRIARAKLTEMDELGLNEPLTAQHAQIPDTKLSRDVLVLYSDISGEAVTAPAEDIPLQIDSLQTAELYESILQAFGVDLFKLVDRPQSLGELVSAVENFAYMDYLPHESLDLKAYPKRISPVDFAAGISASAAVNGIWKTKVTGRENIPEKDGFLICSNHRTVLDPEWVVHAFPKSRRKSISIIGKSDLVFDNMFKRIIKLRNFIPVERFFNTVPTVDRCCELLSDGKNVLIFPEGTNYENAETMMPLKNGAAVIARRTGVPVLPVRISGVAYTNHMKNAFLPPLGGDITITIGKPLDISRLSVQDANEAIKNAIDSL